MVKREEKKKNELNLFWMCVAIVAIVAAVGIVSLINTSSNSVLAGHATCVTSSKYSCSGSTQVLTQVNSNCVKMTSNTACPGGCNSATGQCKPVTTTVRSTTRATTISTTVKTTTRPTTSTSVCPSSTTWKCSGTYEVMTVTQNCQTQTYLPGNYCPTPGCNPSTGRCYKVSTTTSRRTTTTSIAPLPPSTTTSIGTISTPIATCSESDGGFNTAVSGNCIQTNGQSFQDHCHSNMLTEYSCENWAGGKICKEYSAINCPGSCFSGACI